MNECNKCQPAVDAIENAYRTASPGFRQEQMETTILKLQQKFSALGLCGASCKPMLDLLGFEPRESDKK
jgi:hypothetical protein